MPPYDFPEPEPTPFSGFPSLPILTPDPARRSERERYGALFYLGITGLFVLIALVVWFSFGVWTLRSVWMNVYVLHDQGRPESERVQAAFTLSQDNRVNQRQLWDNAMSKPLPPLARYLLAEALTAEAASADPSAYGKAVAQSEGWPVWLRLILTRPMAYAAAVGRPINRDALTRLSHNSDQATALWACYALSAKPPADPPSEAALRQAALTDNPDKPLAAYLIKALDATNREKRLEALDDATLWLRDHHAEVAKLWQGWKIADGRIAREAKPTSNLP